VTAYSERVMDEAIAWHLGLEEAGAEEWRHFVAWLEADPDHQAAYDHVTLTDADLADAFQMTPVPLSSQTRTATRPANRTWLKRTGWGGGLVAAAAAAWLALMPAAIDAPDTYSIATKPGMRHDVTLADGTRIRMNGGTAIQLDRHNPRYAMLERGEAMFDVVHHADKPFEVRVNGVTLRDVGTRFNVVRGGDTLHVAVAEGSVLFQPDREAVSLTKGMQLAMRDGEDRLELSRVEAGAVGGWTEGRLDFHNATLDTVALDVTRATGSTVRMAAPMGTRSFTGTLRVDRPVATVMHNLAALVAGEAHRDGPGWVISPKSPGAS
jgi:transmembrane sensor